VFIREIRVKVFAMIGVRVFGVVRGSKSGAGGSFFYSTRQQTGFTLKPE
jgi:hypothetical protein